MRDFTKKICAVVTLVAMLATLGMTALAVEATGAAIEITGYVWSAVSNGVATVTVTYTVSEDSVGALGATMLTYAKGSYDASFGADDDGIYDGDDTAYADTMQIVGIDQGAPKTLVEGVLTPVDAVEGVYPVGTYVVQFPVAVSNTATSADGVQLGSGEEAVILIGGDNVIAPGALLLTAPYTVWDVESITVTGLGIVNLDTVTVYSPEEEAWLEAVADATVARLTAEGFGYTVTANKGDGSTTDTITLEGLELTAVAVAGDGNYTVTVTVPAGTETDADQGGIVPAGGKTFVVTVSATKDIQMPKWEVKGEAVLGFDTTIDVELSEEDFAAADAAKVKAVLETELADKTVTLNVKKANEEDSTVVIEVTADMIAVTNVATDGDAKSYTGTVTIPADTYAVVGDDDTLTIETPIVIAISGTVAEEVSFIYGDINGDGLITTADLTALRRYLVNDTPDDFIEEAANIYNPATSGITTADLTALRRKLVDATMELPVVE